MIFPATKREMEQAGYLLDGHVSRCGYCGDPLLWALTRAKAKMPLEEVNDPEYGRQLYRPHFATCRRNQAVQRTT